ncbi:MAG: hypothetical protein LBM75_04365 [Myxococcales bacterium]|nr:hypothetical protein [Myxococcales bacterium]
MNSEPEDERAEERGQGAPTWEAIGAALNAGDLPRAYAVLKAMTELDPELAEGWINLGALERAMGELRLAVEHLERGIALLEARSHSIDPLALPAWLNLAEILETLEEVDRSAAALREAYRRDPHSPAPLIQLAGLQARAGHLDAAIQTARDYCRAAVSILSEKASIGLVRKFQKAIEAADTVDGKLLLVATREATAMAFDAAAWPLRDTARFEVPRPSSDEIDDVFELKRDDALIEATGVPRTLLTSPVYGFPGNAPAASTALFTVPIELGGPFPVCIATRTAWNAMALRIRFTHATHDDDDMLRALVPITDWFRRGFDGQFSLQKDKGFFHAISRPVRVGDRGVRFDIDLGLANQTAIAALVEAIADIHRHHPIERVVLGDGLLG